MERDAGGGVGELVEQSECGIGFLGGALQEFDFTGAAVNDHRLGMAGVGEVSAVFGDVGDEVKGGGEKGCAALFEDGAEVAVDLAQENARVEGFGGEFLDEGANDGGDEGGTDAMAHDIADEDAGFGVGERADIKEIAADSAGGEIAVAKAKGALVGRNVGREAGILLRDHGLLNFAGHAEVLFHLLVFDAKFFLALGEFEIGFFQAFFGAAFFGDVPEDALEADDAALGIDERSFDDVDVEFLAAGRLVFFDDFEDFAGLHNELVIFLKFGGHIGGIEIEIGFADDFAEGPAECLAEALVGEGELFVQIFAEDILGESFDEGMVEGLGVAEFLFVPAVLGDVLDGAFVIEKFVVSIAHGADVFGNPNDGSVAAKDFGFEAGDDVIFFHEGNEFVAPVGFDVKFAADIGEAGHQFIDGSKAVDAGESAVGADVFAVRAGLKDAFDGVFKNAAIFFFGLQEGGFGTFALDGVANGAKEKAVGDFAFDEVVLGAFVHGLEGEFFVGLAAQDDDGDVMGRMLKFGKTAEAGAFRKGNIKENNVRGEGLKPGQSGGGCFNPFQFERGAPIFLEHFPDDAGVFGNVLDQENLNGNETHGVNAPAVFRQADAPLENVGTLRSNNPPENARRGRESKRVVKRIFGAIGSAESDFFEKFFGVGKFGAEGGDDGWVGEFSAAGLVHNFAGDLGYFLCAEIAGAAFEAVSGFVEGVEVFCAQSGFDLVQAAGGIIAKEHDQFLDGIGFAGGAEFFEALDNRHVQQTGRIV
jgi:hypothetical protein